MLYHKCDICQKGIKIVNNIHQFNKVYPANVFKEVCDDCLKNFSALINKQKREKELLEKKHVQEMKELKSEAIRCRIYAEELG